MKKNNPMTKNKNIARVKNKDIKTEIFLRRPLWHRRFRYRINYENVLESLPYLFIKI